MPIAPQVQKGIVTVTLSALTQVGREDVTRELLIEVSPSTGAGSEIRSQRRSGENVRPG